MTNNQDVNKTIENFTYNLNNLIGKGAFSSVYLGKCNITGEAVAIKVINLGSLTMETYQKLQEELTILNNLPHHHNIVKMLKALQTTNNVYIITEYCEKKLKKTEVFNNKTIAIGIIEGLKHLYKNNIVHRDLKLDNILVKNGIAKIIDFGFAKTLLNPFEIMNQHLGTPLYMSPQIFDKIPYTSKSDIWSLGVSLHQLIYKCDPYQAKDIQDLKRKIKTVKPAICMTNTTDPLITIIKKCLTVDQTQRISWQQLFTLNEQLKISTQTEVTNNINRKVNVDNNLPFVSRGVQSRVPLVYY